MAAGDLIELEHLRRVNIQTGDVLVYRAHEILNGRKQYLIGRAMDLAFPGTAWLLIEAGATLGVMRKQAKAVEGCPNHGGTEVCTCESEVPDGH